MGRIIFLLDPGRLIHLVDLRDLQCDEEPMNGDLKIVTCQYNTYVGRRNIVNLM